jgi:hypothetical protein
MVETYYFEIECCNPECPQKLFPLSRDVESPGELGELDVKVVCPYCGASNLVNLPAKVVESGTTFRGVVVREE